MTYNYFVAKSYTKEGLLDADARKALKSELIACESLSHKNIITLLGITEDDLSVHLIMEYCQNGDLYKLIVKRGRLPEDISRNLFRQIVEGLDYLHSKGISHRDLKPENILLTSDGTAKIADFGVSKFMPNEDMLKTPCGSPFYAPPEVVRGEEYDGKSRDIWSLGVILYAMVTGSLPWIETNKFKLYKEIEESNIYIPDNLSPKLQVLLRNMLNRDPKFRPTTKDLLNDQWVTNIMQPIKIETICNKVQSGKEKKPNTVFLRTRYPNSAKRTFCNIQKPSLIQKR